MYEIKEYNKVHEEEVKKLWVDVCVEEYGFEIWRDAMNKVIEDEYEKILIAMHDGKVIGTIAYQHFDDSIAEIKRVYVYKEHRGNLVAKDLLDIMMDVIKEKDYKKVLIETWEQFASAIRFYMKHGFELKEQEDQKYIFLKDI